MTETVPIEERVHLLKAIADETRLRILGLIAEAPQSGKQLADALGLTPPTISHHMRRLLAAGIVTEVRQAQRHVYSLNNQLLSSLRTPDQVEHAPVVPDDRARVMKHFFKSGKLVTIPAARKQRVIVLQYLLEQFDPNRSYPEREVNELLGSFNQDFATLRRELVDYGYLVREKGIYQVARSLPERSSNLQQELPANEADWLRAVIQAPLIRD
jgi:biotin operon repressor